jgi:aryl-alcohol dehydrogenase-like predicted oxidoreductase
VDGRAALQAHDAARRHDVPLIANQPHYSMLWRVAEAQVMPELLERVELLRGVADDAGLTTAQLALAWALQHETVASVVVGAGTPEQVTENAKAAGVRLDLDVLTRVDHLLGSFVQTDPRLVWSPPAQLSRPF